MGRTLSSFRQAGLVEIVDPRALRPSVGPARLNVVMADKADGVVVRLRRRSPRHPPPSLQDVVAGPSDDVDLGFVPVPCE